MLSTLACLSCGKKITDKNRNKKIKSNSLPAQNYPETLSIKLKKLKKNLGGSKFFNKRAFIKINDKIKVSEGQLNEADIFFHGRGEDTRQEELTECLADRDQQ